MPGRELTRDQDVFLRQFLKLSFFSKSSDKSKTRKFKGFLDLEDDAQAILDALKGKTPNVGPIADQLNDARRLKAQGKFEAAQKEAERALLMALEVQGNIEGAKVRRDSILKLLDNTFETPPGAIAPEIATLDARRAKIRGHLRNDAPNGGDLDAADRETKALLQDVRMVALAVAARLGVRNGVEDARQKSATRNGVLATDMAKVSKDANFSDITDLKTEIDAAIGGMAGALLGGDHIRIAAQVAVGDGLPAKLNRLADMIDAAETRLMTVALKDAGVSEEQKQKLVSLGKTNPAAMDAARVIFETLKGTLGDTDVDSTVLKARQKAAADATADKDKAKTDLDAAEKQEQDASDLRKQLIADEKTFRAAFKELGENLKAFDAKHKKSLGDPTHPRHERRVTERSLIVTEIKAAQVEGKNKQAAIKAAKTDLKAKTDALTPLQQAFDDATAKAGAAAAGAEAAFKKKSLIDAISFGALSPGNGKALSGAVVVDLIGVYDTDPRVAESAASIACKAANPASVVKCAALVAGNAAKGFKADDGEHFINQDYARTYGDKLMAMSGNFGPDMVDKLGDYIKNGRHFADAPDMDRGATYDEDTRNRTNHVGSALLAGDGSLDFDKGRDALLDVMFHPESLNHPTPAQATHMLETMDYLASNQAARDVIGDVTAPSSPGARGLLARSSGKDAGDIGKGDAQLAVVNAMMTPIYQGKVGSCFATAGIVRMRQTDPLGTLKTFSEMATTGIFTPRSGDPVPVVQNVPTDEDPLVRSLEYSAATATARAVDSSMQKDLEKATQGGVDAIGGGIKSKKWPAVQARLDVALSGAFSFIYDPEAAIGDANDGSSDRGRYQLIDKANQQPINSADEYLAVASPIVMGIIDEKDLGRGVSRSDISDIVASNGFIESLKVGGKLPWALASGGQTDEATKTLFGGDIQTRPFLDEGVPDTSDPAVRTKAILSGLLQHYGDRNDDMATVRTVGMHGFNTLPNHPSMAPLTDGGADKFAENLQRELVDKGAAIRDTVLPLARVIYMFEKEMTALAAKADGDARSAVEAAIDAHRPTLAMTPAEFKAHLKLATTDYAGKQAKIDADAWKTRETDKTGAAPTDEAYAKALADLTESNGKSVENQVTNRLVDDLGAPEFVIADTNWGSGVDHTFFVVIADPATGLPGLFRRADPPGTLTPATKDWVDAQWARVE